MTAATPDERRETCGTCVWWWQTNENSHKGACLDADEPLTYTARGGWCRNYQPREQAKEGER